GAIHGKVGVFQQLVRIDSIIRSHGDADAQIGYQLVPANVVACPDCLLQAVDQINDVFRVRHRRPDDGELIAAETADNVGLAQTAAQTHSDRLEQIVSYRVAERIVYTLEM